MSFEQKPCHVAIVMDGNGRWANSRSLKRTIGHQAGITAVKGVVKSSLKHGIEVLSLFAFGQDNWKRSDEETSFLMQLFYRSLEGEYKKLHAQGVRIRFIGELSAFSDKLLGMIKEAETLTQCNSRLTVVIAVNYSGQWDILQAMHKYQVQQHSLPQTPGSLAPYLATSGLPDPDLFIRTSGEQRISNFMLWQLAYTELYFTQVFWPDFDANIFEVALRWFDTRKRRFGNAKDNANNAKTIKDEHE